MTAGLRSAASDRGEVCLSFPGIAAPVILPPELVPPLRDCLHGWQPEPTPVSLRPGRSGADGCLARITRRGAGYRLASVFLDEPMAGLTAVGAVCALIADLAQARSEAGDTGLGLHCATLCIGGGLVLLAGPARAGKTTLALRLALEPGVALFGDDVLPVRDDGQGMALGVALRLRLPLPQAAGEVLKAAVARHLGPADHRYGYVLPPGQARHGATAPLAALVVIERRPGPARIERLPDGSGLAVLLGQTITRADSAEAALDRVQHLMHGLPVLRLGYDDLEDAVALLLPAVTRPGAIVALPLGDAAVAPVAGPPPRPVRPDRPFSRAPDAMRRRVAGAAVLWRPGEAELWHLNPVADAVWLLLAEPATARQVAGTLAQVFPDVPLARLQRDVAGLLAHLVEAGLVCPRPGENFREAAE